MARSYSRSTRSVNLAVSMVVRRLPRHEGNEVDRRSLGTLGGRGVMAK